VAEADAAVATEAAAMAEAAMAATMEEAMAVAVAITLGVTQTLGVEDVDAAANQLAKSVASTATMLCAVTRGSITRFSQRAPLAPPPTTPTPNDSYTSDANWYMDSGATDHMTNDIEHLHVHENYKGNEQIQVAKCTHIPILHIGESSLSGFSRPLRLSNVLRAPRISKILLSTHKLANDNHCLIEFHHEFFFVKDLTTTATLLKGRTQDGMYPVPPLHPRHLSRPLQVQTISPSKELTRTPCRTCHPGHHFIQ
jgi:hypothetical protein